MHTFPDTQGQPYHEEPLQVPNNICPHDTSVYSSPNQSTSMTTSITTYTQQEDYTSYALTGMETTSVNTSGSSQAPGHTSNYTQYTLSRNHRILPTAMFQNVKCISTENIQCNLECLDTMQTTNEPEVLQTKAALLIAKIIDNSLDLKRFD